MTSSEYNLRDLFKKGTSVLALNVTEYGVTLSAYADEPPRTFVIEGDRILTTTEPVPAKGDQ